MMIMSLIRRNKNKSFSIFCCHIAERIDDLLK
jgi:hypothetical protein